MSGDREEPDENEECRSEQSITKSQWPAEEVDRPEADHDQGVVMLRCNSVSDEEEIVLWLEGREDEERSASKAEQERVERGRQHQHGQTHQRAKRSRCVSGSKRLEPKMNEGRGRKTGKDCCKGDGLYDSRVRAGDSNASSMKRERHASSHCSRKESDEHGKLGRNGLFAVPGTERAPDTSASSDVLDSCGGRNINLISTAGNGRKYAIGSGKESPRGKTKQAKQATGFYGAEMEMGRILKQRVDLIMKHYHKIQRLEQAFDDVEFVIYTARCRMLREQTELRVHASGTGIVPTRPTTVGKANANRQRVFVCDSRAATKKNHERLKEEARRNQRTLFVIIADECHWVVPEKPTATTDFISEWSKEPFYRNVVVLQVSAAPLSFITGASSCIPPMKCALRGRDWEGHEKLMIHTNEAARDDSDAPRELHVVRWEEVLVKNFRKGVRTKLRTSPMIRPSSRERHVEYVTVLLREGCSIIATTRDPRQASQFTIQGEHGVVSLQTRIYSTDCSVAEYVLAVDGDKLVAQRKEDMSFDSRAEFRVLLEFGAGLVAFRSLHSEFPDHYICIDARSSRGVELAVPRVRKKRGIPILQSQSGNPRQQCFVFHMEPCQEVDDGEAQYLGLNYYLGTMSNEGDEERKLRDDSLFQDILMKSPRKFSGDDLLAADYAYHILHHGAYQSTESVLSALEGQSYPMAQVIAEYLRQLEVKPGCIAPTVLLFVRKCYVRFLQRKLQSSGEMADLKYWVACRMHFTKKEHEVHMSAAHPLNKAGREMLARNPHALVDIWVKTRSDLSETSRIVDDLVTSRTSLGKMKIVRVKSQKSAAVFFNTVKLAQTVAGREQSFPLLKDYGTQQLQNQMEDENSRFFFQKLQTGSCRKNECKCQEYVRSPVNANCRRCSHVHKKIQRYVDLQGMPCILLLAGKGRTGDTFPNSFDCLDLRGSSESTASGTRSPNTIYPPSLVRALGWMCRYVQASPSQASVVPYALLSWRLCDSIRRSLRESPAFSTMDCISQPSASRSVHLNSVSRQWCLEEQGEMPYEEGRAEQHTNRLILHAEAQTGKTGSYLYFLKLLRDEVVKSNENNNPKEQKFQSCKGRLRETKKTSLSSLLPRKGQRNLVEVLTPFASERNSRKSIESAQLSTAPTELRNAEPQTKALGCGVYGQAPNLSSEVRFLGITPEGSKPSQLKASTVCGTSATDHEGNVDCQRSLSKRKPPSPVTKTTSRQTDRVANTAQLQPGTTKRKPAEKILRGGGMDSIPQAKEQLKITDHEKKSKIGVKRAIQELSPTWSAEDDGYENDYWSFKRRKQEKSPCHESGEARSRRKRSHPDDILSEGRRHHQGLGATRERYVGDGKSRQSETLTNANQAPLAREEEDSSSGSFDRFRKAHRDNRKLPHAHMPRKHEIEALECTTVKRKTKETAEPVSRSEKSRTGMGTKRAVPVSRSRDSEFREWSKEEAIVKCLAARAVAAPMAASNASSCRDEETSGHMAKRKRGPSVAVSHRAEKSSRTSQAGSDDSGSEGDRRRRTRELRESGESQGLQSAVRKDPTEATHHEKTTPLRPCHERNTDSDFDRVQPDEILLDDMEDSEGSDCEGSARDIAELNWRYPSWRDIKEAESLLCKSVQKGSARTVNGQVYTHDTHENPIGFLSDHAQAEVGDNRIAVSLRAQLPELVEPKECRAWHVGHKAHCTSCRSWFGKLDDPLELSLVIPLGDEKPTTIHLSIPTVAPYADIYHELKQNGPPTTKGALYNPHRPGIKYWVFHPCSRNPRTSLLNYRHVLGPEPIACIQAIVVPREDFRDYQHHWGKSHMIIELPSRPQAADRVRVPGCEGGIGYARRFIQLFAFALKMEYAYILDDDIMFMAAATFPSRSEGPFTSEGSGALVMKRCPFTQPLKVMKELAQGTLDPPVKDFEPYPFECITKSNQAKRYPLYSYTGPAKDIDSAPDKGYALMGMLSRFPKAKRPFSRAHVSGAVLLNVTATVENGVLYRPWPCWDDVRFSDDCDLNWLWVVRINRFLLAKSSSSRECTVVDEVPPGVYEWTEETELVHSDTQGPVPSSEQEVSSLLIHLGQRVQDEDSCTRLRLHSSSTEERRLLTEVYHKLPVPEESDSAQASPALCFTFSPQQPAAETSWKAFNDVLKARKRVWCVMPMASAANAGMTSLRTIRDSGHVRDALRLRKSRVRVFTAFNPQIRRSRLLLIDITFRRDFPSEVCTKTIKETCETVVQARATAFEFLEDLLRVDSQETTAQNVAHE